MERYRHQPEEVEHVVFQYNYTIEEEADNVISFCKSKDRVDFEELFSTCADRHQAIFRFLSVLDLIQLQRIDLLIGEGFNQFWVSYNQFREDDAA